MIDPSGDGLKRRFQRFLLDLDARIDSGLFHAGRWGRELYERYLRLDGRLACRRLEALGPGRADLGGRDLGHRRPRR